MGRRKPLQVNRVSVDMYNQYTAHQIDLLRYSASQARDVVGMLRDVERDVIEVLKKDYKVYEATGNRNINKWRQARLARIHDNIVESLGEYKKKIVQWQRGQLVELIDSEFEFANDAFNSAIGADVLVVTPTAAQIGSMASNVMIEGAPSKQWWSKHADNIQDKFMRTVRTGMYQGEGIDRIVRRVRDSKSVAGVVAGGDIPDARTPLFRTFKRNVEAITRTSVLTAANDARNRWAQENNDIMSGMEFTATLDGRTTPQCRGYDGLQWDMQENPIGGHNKVLRYPPLHWNCRSIMSYITKSWDELAGVKVKTPRGEQDLQSRFEASLRKRGWSDDEIAKATRNARASSAPDYAGPVAKKDYNDWLKARPVAYQKEILGETRYKLWKEEKLHLKDMLDQRANPLTIEQLRLKIAAESNKKIPSL